MNIFAVSNCPEECAEYLDNKRLVKMVLETAQLLCTALRFHGCEESELYRMSHVNHPCSVWVRTSRENYNWTLRLFRCLSVEYTSRYGRVHKCNSLYPMLKTMAGFIPDGEMTEFVNCAANEGLGISYKHIEDVHVAYKMYLTARWKAATIEPSWDRKVA